jgi:hypothetical protein
MKLREIRLNTITGVFGCLTGLEAVAEAPLFLLIRIIRVLVLLYLSILLDHPVTFSLLRPIPLWCCGGIAEGENVLGGLIDQGEEVRVVILTKALSTKVRQLNANLV